MPIDFADTAGAVRVAFPMTESNWNTVVKESRVATVETEDMQEFIVEYPSRDAFESECVRFGGLIEYRVLPN